MKPKFKVGSAKTRGELDATIYLADEHKVIAWVKGDDSSFARIFYPNGFWKKGCTSDNDLMPNVEPETTIIYVPTLTKSGDELIPLYQYLETLIGRRARVTVEVLDET